jgi:gas vesicle protein
MFRKNWPLFALGIIAALSLGLATKIFLSRNSIAPTQSITNKTQQSIKSWPEITEKLKNRNSLVASLASAENTSIEDLKSYMLIVDRWRPEAELPWNECAEVLSYLDQKLSNHVAKWSTSNSEKTKALLTDLRRTEESIRKITSETTVQK